MLRSGLAYLLTRLVSGGVGIFTVAFIARNLSPVEFGYFNMATALAATGSSIFFQWLSISVGRFWAEYEQKNEIEFISTLVFTFVIIGLFFVACIEVLTVSASSEYHGLIIACSLLAIANATFDFSTRIANARLNVRLFSVMTLIRALSIMTFAGIFVVITGQAIWTLVGTAFGWLLGTLPNYGVLRYIDYKNISREILETCWRYSLPLIGILSLSMVINYSDRIIISQLSGASEAGRYGALCDLGQQTAGMLMSVLYTTVFPVLVKQVAAEGLVPIKEWKRYQEWFIFLTAPVVIGTFIFRNLIVHSFLGPIAQTGDELVFFLVVLGVWLFGLKGFCLDAVFQLKRNTLTPTIVMAFGAAANIVLNFLLIPFLGILGSAIVFIVVGLTLVIMSGAIIQRELSTPISTFSALKNITLTIVIVLFIAISEKIFLEYTIPFGIVAALCYITASICCNFCNIRNFLTSHMDYKNLNNMFSICRRKR